MASPGLSAPAVAAGRGPCLPGEDGPQCHVWKATVLAVHDGDTIDVRLAGRRRRVRLTGINATELRVYSSNPRKRRGECHAEAATSRLARLVRRSRRVVRLAALDPGSRSGRRLRRALAVRVGGRWRDAGSALLGEGHALWLPNSSEYAWNRAYSELAERAAARGLRLWDPASCGRGPHQDSPLRLWVNWNAEGFDSGNLNDEWVRIKNLDRSTEISLARWWIRDSDLRRYTFPSGTRVPPGGTVTVHVGRGANTATAFHWGLSSPAFDNATDDELALGDGGYLFDPDGDLRAWMTYPCRPSCADPLRGRVDLSAHPGSPESVTVTNAGSSAIDLEGYRLASAPYEYSFRADAWLEPRESLVVNLGRGTDTRLVKHWGLQRSILDDAGDRVSLESFAGGVVDCHAWGRASC